jgi:hypothetical protein
MSTNWHRFPPAGYDGDFIRADIAVDYWGTREDFEHDLDAAIQTFRAAALRAYDRLAATDPGE